MADPLLKALNLISMTGLDRPSYIEDLDEVLLRNQERSLQESYAQHGTIGPDPNYDEEGNIIPQELWAPDLSFAPLISPKNITGGLKNLWQRIGFNVLKGEKISPLGRLFQKSTKAMVDAETKARVLRFQGKEKAIELFAGKHPYHHGDVLLPPGKRVGKTVRKIQDEVARELGSKEGFKRYLNTLLEQDPTITPSTNLKANRARMDLIERLSGDKDLYQSYKDAIVENINMAEYRIGLNIDPSQKIGMEWRGLYTAPWYASGYTIPSVLERPLSALLRKSTKVHEYTHAGQLGRKIPKETLRGDEYGVALTSLTGRLQESLYRAAGKDPKKAYRFQDILSQTLHDEEQFRTLAGFQKLIDKNIKSKTMERIDIYRKSPKGSKAGEVGSFDNYLRSWYEVTARIGEMRYAEKIGKNYKETGAYRNLTRLFDDKFITKLKNDYWAVAPIGIGVEAMDDEVYEDLK